MPKAHPPPRRPPKKLVCSTCGKTTRARWADVLQGWIGDHEQGTMYCSDACVRARPPEQRKRKGRGRTILARATAPAGATAADLDRWAEGTAEEFAKLAVKVLLLREEEERRRGQATAEAERQRALELADLRRRGVAPPRRSATPPVPAGAGRPATRTTGAHWARRKPSRRGPPPAAPPRTRKSKTRRRG